MIETNIQNQKELFLKSEFFMLSWEAAVQHNGIWKNNPTQETKDDFREEIKAFLEKNLMNTYQNYTINIIIHIKHLTRLKDLEIQL